MGDDRPERLCQYAVFEAPAKVVFNSLRPWRLWGRVECRRVESTALGALKRFPSPFGMWTGRGTSVQPLPPASMGCQIPFSFCGSTLSPFMQLEAMVVSWRIGSRWLQRTSPDGGSWVCRQGPYHPGVISASASSTSTLPWGRSQRARRRTLPSMASSQGARRQSWGLGGSAFPPSAEKK
jgi:hypothetical protein